MEKFIHEEIQGHHPLNRYMIHEFNMGERLGDVEIGVYAGENIVPHFHLDSPSKNIHISIC